MSLARRWTIALVAFVLAVPAAAQDPSPAAAAASQPAESLYAIVLEPGPAWKPGKPFQEQGLGPHLQYWLALHREGRIVTAGPLGDDSGLVVFYAADPQAAQAILEGDPAIGTGVFTGTVRPYAPPMVNAARLAQSQPAR